LFYFQSPTILFLFSSPPPRSPLRITSLIAISFIPKLVNQWAWKRCTPRRSCPPRRMNLVDHTKNLHQFSSEADNLLTPLPPLRFFPPGVSHPVGGNLLAGSVLSASLHCASSHSHASFPLFFPPLFPPSDPPQNSVLAANWQETLPFCDYPFPPTTSFSPKTQIPSRTSQQAIDLSIPIEMLDGGHN